MDGLNTKIRYAIGRFAAFAVLLLTTPTPAPGQSGQTPAEMGAMDSTDHASTMVAHEAMSGSMTEDVHMRLTALRPGNAGDSARAAQLVADMRRTLARYQDVRVAEAEGFRRFLPGVKQPVYHFTNWRWAVEAMCRALA